MKQARIREFRPMRSNNDNAHANSPLRGDVAETNDVTRIFRCSCFKIKLINCDVPNLLMVDRMKTIEAELFQMIKSKMSAPLSQTNVAELSLETPLKDLGFDSLDKVCLLFEIEERFNVAIPDITDSQMKCGADILAYVSSGLHALSQPGDRVDNDRG
jgi:acyl carrier protein